MGRTVTLVVVGDDGDVRGELAPFDVDSPWWQDLEPILDAHPEVVVLRLLDVVPAPDGRMGGQVRYVVEAGGSALAGLRPLRAPVDLDDHPLRMPWARPGGPAADLEWAARQVDLRDRPLQVRSWNLSSIWRLPTPDGDVWMKCVPPFFAHEAVVLQELAWSPSVPRLVAADGHRMLLEAMPGEDGYGAPPDERERMAATLAELLASTTDHIDALVAAGVPDWRAAVLRELAREVIARDGVDDDPLLELIDSWDDRFSAAEDAGVPDSLFHGDPHPGNARSGVDPPVVFDWGDSTIGHPLLDGDVLAEHGMLDATIAAWRRAVPGCDPRRAWDALRPIAILRGAVVFRRFLDNIEPSERVYHQDDVTSFLTRARAALA